MAIEFSHPLEAQSVSEMLQAMGIEHGTDASEPEPYLVIPGSDGPRWLIPAHSRAAASALKIWHPYNLSSRLKWFALRMAARAGVLRHARSVAIVATSRQEALRWFERCGLSSQNGEMVILIGSPSPDRKLIAFLLDDAHRIAAVLKVGLTAGGGLSILHEAEMLRALEPHSWSPKLLSVHPDLRAASQRFVLGSMPDRRFRPEYMDLLCQLPRSGGAKTLTAVAEEMAKRLSPFKARLDAMAPGVIDRALGSLDLDLAVPTMLAHGDFAPWNMRDHPRLGYVLVDWEWANFNGLPAYDLFHFHFNGDRLFGGTAGGYSAIRSKPICAEYFRRMDLDIALLPQLAVAYQFDQLEAHCHGRGFDNMEYTLRQLAVIAEQPG